MEELEDVLLDIPAIPPRPSVYPGVTGIGVHADIGRSGPTVHGAGRVGWVRGSRSEPCTNGWQLRRAYTTGYFGASASVPDPPKGWRGKDLLAGVRGRTVRGGAAPVDGINLWALDADTAAFRGPFRVPGTAAPAIWRPEIVGDGERFYVVYAVSPGAGGGAIHLAEVHIPPPS